MTAITLTFPAKAAIVEHISSHPAAQETDVRELIPRVAEVFAGRTQREDEIELTLRLLITASSECGIERLALLKSLVIGLIGCARPCSRL